MGVAQLARLAVRRQMGLKPEDLKDVDGMWRNLDDLSESVRGCLWVSARSSLTGARMRSGPGGVPEAHRGDHGRGPTEADTGLSAQAWLRREGPCGPWRVLSFG